MRNGSRLPFASGNIFPILMFHACACLASPSATADEPRSSEQPFLRLRLDVNKAGSADFGSTYRSYRSDGSEKLVFKDPVDRNPAANHSTVSIGIRLSRSIWIEADYTSFSGKSYGKIGTRAHLGPFDPYVFVPTVESYRFRMSGLRVRHLLADDSTVRAEVLGGLTIIDAAGTVSSAGVGSTSEHGIAPLPMLGGRLAYPLAPGVQIGLSGDYSGARTSRVSGSITNIVLEAEWRVSPGVVLSCGYRQSRLKADFTGSHYLADIEYRSTAPFVSIVREFY